MQLKGTKYKVQIKNYPMGSIIDFPLSHVCDMKEQYGPLAQTFLSHGRQPEIEFFPFWSVFTLSRL